MVSDSHNLSHFGWSVSFDIFQSQQLRNKITCHWVERSHVECIAVCKHRSSSKMRLYIDRMLWSRMHLKETISSPWQEKISAGHQTVSGGSSSLPGASGCPIQVRQVAQPTLAGELGNLTRLLAGLYLLSSTRYRFCNSTPRSFNWTWYLQPFKLFIGRSRNSRKT